MAVLTNGQYDDLFVCLGECFRAFAALEVFQQTTIVTYRREDDLLTLATLRDELRTYGGFDASAV